MTAIGENSIVTIIYQGKLDNGDLFTTVDEENPMVIKIGNSDIPPTLEQALIGMDEGQSKTVRLSPEEGYGPRQKILLQTINKNKFGDSISPKPGMILSLKVSKDGKDHQVPATVMEVNNESVVIDYNHPLAGHHLTYNVKILKIANT